jgi:hypothetical protein
VFARGDHPSAAPHGDPHAPAPGPAGTDATAAPTGSTPHSADFVHQLRNRLFAMSALFDVLELRAADTPAVERYLPHLRLELSRIEQFAEDWKEEALAEPSTDPAPSLPGVLAAAIERVSEDAALRDVFLSLVCEPDSRRVVRRPTLLTAALALLLEEAVRSVAPGTHVWLRAVRTARGEAAVALCADGAPALAGVGVELARATLRALGGELSPADPANEGNGAAIVVVQLGPYA